MVPNKPKKSLKKRKACGPAIVERTTEMDVKIWKNFPEELMEAVIARLPITALVRSRLVCRNFNSLLGSPGFKFECQNFPRLFVTYTASGKIITRCRADEEMKGAVYDPLMKKWHYDFPIPSFTDSIPFFWDSFPTCAAGGLVCYAEYMGSTFHVGNPLTQTWKQLSFSKTSFRMLQGSGHDAIGIVSLDHPPSYQIVWVRRSGHYGVYDSLTRNTCIGRVPANIKLPSQFVVCSSVTIGTVVYFLCWIPNGILSYDVVSGAWEQLQLPFPPLANNVAFGLAESEGRMLLVVFEQNTNLASFSVSVWEFQREVMVWAEFDRMPNSLGSEFRDEHISFKCVGNKRLLVMSLRTGRRNRIFMYDVVSREWSELPPFVPPRERCRRRAIANGVGFFPSLVTSLICMLLVLLYVPNMKLLMFIAILYDKQRSRIRGNRSRVT